MGSYCGYIGIMEKNMETTVVYRGYIGIMASSYQDTEQNPLGRPILVELNVRAELVLITPELSGGQLGMKEYL